MIGTGDSPLGGVGGVDRMVAPGLFIGREGIVHGRYHWVGGTSAIMVKSIGHLSGPGFGEGNDSAGDDTAS